MKASILCFVLFISITSAQVSINAKGPIHPSKELSTISIKPPAEDGSKMAGIAILTLSLGLTGLLLSFTLPGLLLCAGAIVLGILALRKIKRAEGKLRGKGMAIAGMVAGSLGMLVLSFLVYFGWRE